MASLAKSLHMADSTGTAYGEWPSPITPEVVAGGGVDFAGVACDEGTAWWLERRPDEEGRGVLVREGGDEPVDVTPSGYDIRTLVHEYGGGDFLVDHGTAWFANFEDQRLYRQRSGEDPEPITPAPAVERGDRYADLAITPDGERLYCVRERHTADGDDDEPTNTLVTLPADGSDEPSVVAEGHDFYSFPRVNPDGSQLAWTAWDHPAMSWDETTLHVATVADDGRLDDEREVLGGSGESVFQPAWSPAGGLHAVSDRSGWWNPYRIDDGEPVALHPAEAEFGVPQWVFGLSTYAVLDDGRIAVRFGSGGDYDLGLLDTEGALETIDLPDAYFPGSHIETDGEAVVFVAASPTQPTSIVRWRPGEEPSILERSSDLDVDPAYLAEPEQVTFPTGDDEEAHALFYPPRNPDVDEPHDERPPLVTLSHGGPTSETLPALSLGGLPSIQYLTTRGIAVVDVNYRGSTGYGRAYRDRLDGEWGVVDTVDCVNAAEYLADRGRVDGDRLAIEGGSAGGYATLCGLTFHDTFDAGVSHFGVADVEALARDTHKFESRYLDGLIGPLPEARETYRERSPVHHAERIGCPALLLQGGEDAVVPASQAKGMIAALADIGVPHAYLEFESEQHGFRQADSIRRAAAAELSFYGQVFGFTPADDLEPVTLTPEE
jgi:dipeptidyl aminopeptidase/acylaminoacyl peptidase